MTAFKVGDSVVFLQMPSPEEEKFIRIELRKMGPGPYRLIKVVNLIGTELHCNCGAGNEDLCHAKHSFGCPVKLVLLKNNQNQRVILLNEDGVRGVFSGYWFEEYIAS